MRKVLLDTNAYAALLRGDEKVLSAMSRAETIYMSAIVLGELFSGFRGGKRFVENRKILERFLDRPHVALLPVGMETADVFGSIKQQLKEQGAPISINNVWIAAHALETGSVVVTYDTHFKQVAGLRLWDEV